MRCHLAFSPLALSLAALTLFCLCLAPCTVAAGSLTGTSTAITASQPINLTTQGTADWAHWATTTATSFDHKVASGTTPVGLISNYTVIGSGTVVRYATSFVNCSWTDGTPTASATNSGEVYITTNGNGFSITAPADTTTRTLTVYVGGYNDYATLTAHLSDGSAADFTDASYGYNKPGNSDGAHYQAMYTLTYGAASAGQTLTVSWVQTSSLNTSGNVTLQAATLAIAPLAPTYLTATATSSQIGLTWTASSGATSYSLYRGTAAGGEGTTAYKTGLTGTGYTDPAAVSGTTYYYTLKAVNNGGPSAASNEASATIPDFSITASPSSFGIAASGSAATALTLTPYGSFSGSVALTVSGLPANVAAAFSPASPVSVAAGTAIIDTLTLTATNAGSGTYGLTVTATCGALTHNVPLMLTVAPAQNPGLTDIYFTGSALTNRIDWNPYNGGNTLDYYSWTRDGGGPNYVSTPYLIDSTGLALGTKYTYTINAYTHYFVADPHTGQPVEYYATILIGTCAVTDLESLATDDQSVDSRLDPRYSTNTLVNHNFTNPGSTPYRGGLFAGFVSDGSRVGRSLIKFSIPALPTGQHPWRAGSVYAFATRGFTPNVSTTTTVSCQRVSDTWTGATVTWGLAPAMPASGNSVAITYDGSTPIVAWERWPMSADIYSVLTGSGTLSVGLASINESSNGWMYFAKKEYSATLTPYVLYAYGAPN